MPIVTGRLKIVARCLLNETCEPIKEGFRKCETCDVRHSRVIALTCNLHFLKRTKGAGRRRETEGGDSSIGGEAGLFGVSGMSSANWLQSDESFSRNMSKNATVAEYGLIAVVLSVVIFGTIITLGANRAAVFSSPGSQPTVTAQR